MVPSTEVRNAIADTNARFLDAFNKADAPGCVSATYTPDAEILPSNFDIIEGTSGIQAFWQGAMDLGVKSATLETIELEEHGDAVVEIGKYTLAAEGGHQIDEGKYLVVWKQQAGQWKWHRDIWNTSVPAAEG